MVSKLFTTFVTKIKSPQKILIMTTYRFAITGLRHHDFANRLDELYDKAMGKRMSKKSIPFYGTFSLHGRV